MVLSNFFMEKRSAFKIKRQQRNTYLFFTSGNVDRSMLLKRYQGKVEKEKQTLNDKTILSLQKMSNCEFEMNKNK